MVSVKELRQELGKRWEEFSSVATQVFDERDALKVALKESDGRVGSMQEDYGREYTRANKAEAERDALCGKVAALRKLLQTDCEICNERDKFGSCPHEHPGGCSFHDALATNTGKAEADVITAAIKA